MIPLSLISVFAKVQNKYPYITPENFYRLQLLYYGLAVGNKTSFPNQFTRTELILTPKGLTSFPVMTFYKPHSPFKLINTSNNRHVAILYQDKFIAEAADFEARTYNLNTPEPYYFFVREINGDLVLKINPIQLCNFYQSHKGDMPCEFCFRNDFITRYRNITAKNLINLIKREQKQYDNFRNLSLIDEISIITGTYHCDETYLKEISTLIQRLKGLVSENIRIVVGSHEAKGQLAFEVLKKAGATTFAFPVESLDDHVRQRNMNNRKSNRLIEEIEQDLIAAHQIFGDDKVIIRLIAGIGDSLTDNFARRIKRLTKLWDKGPLWNINVYMPFTHYHTQKFSKTPPYNLDYLYHYCSIINQYVRPERLIRFKISP